MAPKLTFIYIVEPPRYDEMACTLLASIRTYFPEDVAAIGYCGEDKIDTLHPGIRRAHELMNAEIRTFGKDGMWETPYPHGNKLLAALDRRDTEFTAFIDSDVLFVEPNSVDALVREGSVSAAPATSLSWATDEIWESIYGEFGLPVPEERISLTRKKKPPRVPYFNSGVVCFPEAPGPKGRFADIWYETALRIDAIQGLVRKRPYLDQMSLPVAIRRSGLTWNRLPEEQNYLLGGRIRGRPLPTDRKIYAVHYRHEGNLADVGLTKKGRRLLQQKTGRRFVRRLALDAPAPKDATGS